jgi:ABC-type glycerol-3-phosphate transport system substrate-binding protein
MLDVPAEKLRGTLVRFWHPWIGAAAKTISTQIEQFNLTNPYGILVVPIQFPGYDALDSAVNSHPSEPPQIAAGFQHQALAWDQAEPLVDLQPYLNDPEWGLDAVDQADLYSAFWDPEVVDGRRLGLPAFRSASLLLYNQTWARELGFQAPPVTPEQFRQQACAAAQYMSHNGDRSTAGTGGYIISTDYPVLLSWIYAFGGDPLKTPEPGASQSVYQFDTPEAAKALSFLRELYDGGCAWESRSPAPDSPFAGRLGLFASASVFDLPDMTAAFKRAENLDEWVVIPYPSPVGSPALDAYGPSYFVFPATPEQQLASWLFLRWLTAADNHARLIEATGALPVRAAALDELADYEKSRPQWRQAVDLIGYARPEPAYASWRKVRFALGDAATQLFRSYFTLEQIPAMLTYLDSFAAELHLGANLPEVFGTLTHTPTSTFTPTRTPTPTRTSRPTVTPTP